MPRDSALSALRFLEIAEVQVAGLSNMDRALDLVFGPERDRFSPGFAIAINPEKIMMARANPEIKEILSSATLPYADGIGVICSLRRKGASDAVRIPGCEFWEAVMKVAGEKGHSVFLVGARDFVGKEVQIKLSQLFQTNIAGQIDGYFEAQDEAIIIRNIKNSQARIVSVAMGSPRQEVFIQKCRKIYPEAFYMGVGGAYDAFVGEVRRAPKWMRLLNLEWFYRLISDPIRIKRQAALLGYAYLMLRGRL